MQSKLLLCLGFWTILTLCSTGATAGERYAFLVGVREYDRAELTSLRYTERDVTRLAEVLRRSGYADENVILLTQESGAAKARFAPFSRNIRKELALLLETVSADDSVLLAFSGHGVQFQGEKGAYFCPADASLEDRTTLVSLADVYETLDRCPAVAKVLFVDACRNDPQSAVSRSARGAILEPVGRPQQMDVPGGIVAFFACSPGQMAYEDPKVEHGVFFHFVIEGLNGRADVDGDNAVSFDELKLFTKKRVQTMVRAEFGRLQTPEDRGTQRGEVLLVSLPAQDKAAPADPETEARKLAELEALKLAEIDRKLSAELKAKESPARPAPRPAPRPRVNLEGTSWSATVPDNRGAFSLRFLPKGALEYRDRDQSLSGTWAIAGGQFTLNVSNGLHVLNGVHENGRLSGKAVSRNGSAWNWEAVPETNANVLPASKGVQSQPPQTTDEARRGLPTVKGTLQRLPIIGGRRR